MFLDLGLGCRACLSRRERTLRCVWLSHAMLKAGERQTLLSSFFDVVVVSVFAFVVVPVAV